MKVRLIKVHQAWNTLYPNEFVAGDILDLNGHIVTTKNGNKFSADDLCSAFSNHCSYSDIFEKVIDTSEWK